MKKILSLMLIAFLSMQICFAQEESEEDIDSYFTEPEQTTQLNGYLQYNQNAEQKEQESIELKPQDAIGINLTKPKKIGPKSLISNSKKPSFNPIQEDINNVARLTTKDYDIRPFNTSYSKQFGKFHFGTMYDSSLDSAQVSYSTGLFSKYEGKHFAFGAGFSKSTSNNSDYYNDKFYIAPELKLTKKLSLLDVMQTDVNQINQKNELVLRYTPHFKKHADDVQFEVGAGQSYYQNNYINSSLRFSTKFKL